MLSFWKLDFKQVFFNEGVNHTILKVVRMRAKKRRWKCRDKICELFVKIIKKLIGCSDKKPAWNRRAMSTIKS